ncbi:branched-chain amino acid ABC transporter permease [Iamia sp. SCSIO 61187]|uniref:branched-chain amino acid ABC transporter permease n=1 Tax=Iamia sp. SCSIO 61187 TaxID=2722752 RepID=UPI001C6275AA|nr:branched-chain amino acid ABC transporter permease [Iamia sp. SCSIO 61187]QYG91665.1 branched-chain amino acid ABC transporter permease [Iamia sp. SCSIO 61187]
MSEPSTPSTRRTGIVFLVVLLALLALELVGGAPAGAAGSDPGVATQAEEPAAPTVRGTLENKKGTRDRSDDEPVPDVTVVLLDEGGDEVAETESDDEGAWEIEAPGPGTYSVQLDQDTLPDGVGLTERPDTTVQLAPGDSQIQIFQLGARTRNVTSAFDKFLQLGFTGIRFGLIIAIAAVGLSLIFGTTGLTNFAHGEMVTFGGIAAWYANVDWGLPFIPAALVAIAAGAGGAAAMEVGIWRRLRRRGVSLLAMMVVSIGLSIVLRYGFQMFFGASPRVYAAYQEQDPIIVGPVRMAPRDLWSIGIILAVLVAVAFVLQRTRIGKAMRAVADNRDLAASSGIDVDRIILFVWVLGGGLAALGGLLFALNERISFNSGFSLLLLMFAGITLGGLGTAYGALVGSFIVGMFIQISTLDISESIPGVPPNLKNVGALLVLILVLLVRPQGILGRAERVG